MKDKDYKFKLWIIREVLKRKIKQREAARRLGVSIRSIKRYCKRFLQGGEEGLRDKRSSNNRKICMKEELMILKAKREKKHRSARFIRDHLKLNVSVMAVWFILKKHNLNRVFLPPIKPIVHFEAKRCNDIWQIDIMGKIRFPKIGCCYLITITDDKSRFILSGGWYRSQHKIHVFACLYRAFMRYGIPKCILSDKGRQFKSSDIRGLSDFEDYMRILGIKPIYAKKARTKGKIERRFEFIQRDFVLENIDVDGIEELNDYFERWMNRFNYEFKSRAIGNRSPAEVYQASRIRKSKEELQVLLVHEEPRRVYLDGTISYYGNTYRVPPGYIKCRVWTKLRGDTLFIEAGGKVIAKHKLVR